MMKFNIMRVLFVGFLVLYFAETSCGNDVMEITWESLVPQLPPQEDPLAHLSEEKQGLVEWIIYVRETLPEEITPENQEVFDEMEKALVELKEKDIDIDRIIAERRKRNSAINSELDGKVVKLAGYLLPLDLSGKAVTDFLLVPYVGACIHTPPPPPNQIVHAASETPRPYEIESLYLPVWITGQLKVKSLSKELFLNDGSSNIDIGYTMAVKSIEKYRRPE